MALKLRLIYKISRVFRGKISNVKEAGNVGILVLSTLCGETLVWGDNFEDKAPDNSQYVIVSYSIAGVFSVVLVLVVS